MSKNTSNNIRVVFDTNIYVAAFLHSGLSEELVDRGLKGDYKLYSSPDLLAELERKIVEKSIADHEKRLSFTSMIYDLVTVVYPTEAITAVSRDPDDNKVLECALEAKAQLIVTLDHDLLDLKNWRGIAIAHPKSFTWIIPDE